MPLDDLPPMRVLLTTPDGVEMSGFPITGQEAATRWWWRLRDAYPHTGRWPLITDLSSLDVLASGYADRPTWRRHADQPPEAAGDARAWLAAGGVPQPDPDDIGTWPGEADDEEPDDEEERQPERYRHSVFTDWRGQPKPVVVALVPAGDGGWDIPLTVGFGWFNECPEPYEHAAILRRWHERWGADLFAMQDASPEFEVSRPPSR